MCLKKDLKISDEAQGSANTCAKDKECLKNSGGLCPVISEVSDSLIYVLKKSAQKCNYYVHFGYNGFCNCPVRKEIYRNYKI